MKLLATLFAFLLLSNTIAFSQKTYSKKDFNDPSELVDSLKGLKKELIITKEQSLTQKENLTKELNNASNTVSYLNSVIGTFSTFISILGIFLAIIAIVVPFATYQYAVKPSQEALKELEKNFDNRLEQYLWENRNNQINKALENIKNGNAEEKSLAISFLTFSQSEGLTDNQLFQVYNILKKNQSDYNIKSQLAFILSTRKTDYATELFNSSTVKDDPVISQMAIIYYAKTGYKSNYEGINHIIGENKSQDLNFNAFIANLNQYNSSDIIEAINDKKIIDLLTKETLATLKVNFAENFESVISQTTFKESYLAKRIKTNI